MGGGEYNLSMKRANLIVNFVILQQLQDQILKDMSDLFMKDLK